MVAEDLAGDHLEVAAAQMPGTRKFKLAIFGQVKNVVIEHASAHAVIARQSAGRVFEHVFSGEVVFGKR